MWLTGTQALGPSSTVFPGILTGSWSQSGGARNRTGTLTLDSHVASSCLARCNKIPFKLIAKLTEICMSKPHLVIIIPKNSAKRKFIVMNQVNLKVLSAGKSITSFIRLLTKLHKFQDIEF